MFSKVIRGFTSRPVANGVALVFLLVTASPLFAATFTVTSTADSGAGTLRQAMLDAESATGHDEISFNLPGTSPFTITPLTALPSIQEGLTLDGTTQPGYAGSPLIELRGSSAGANVIGLYVLAEGCVIRGLCINSFTRNGIRIEYLGGSVIQGCYVGTDIHGTNALGNGQSGILVQTAGNLIGGTNAEQRNVVAGGNLSGVYLNGTQARSNRVIGNYIGVDATGRRALGNDQDGVVVNGASENCIGGSGPGEGNVISGNVSSGIIFTLVGAVSNRVEGNFIGTDASGHVALTNHAHGVKIARGSWNIIGGAEAVARNVISGNALNGVYVETTTTGGTNNVIQGNFIGTDVTGTNRLANIRGHGVRIETSHNVVGGGNVVSGNGFSGVAITAAVASDNRIVGNLIGADFSGTRALPNGNDGVTVMGATNNVVGGTTAAERNVISGNRGNGVLLQTPAARQNTIQGNYIGTDVSGTLSLGNELAGVCIEGAANIVGGSQGRSGNVISGNLSAGVLLLQAGAANNVVAGNFIGTDVAGTKQLANAESGIYISGGSSNLIGGTGLGAGNILSGNTGSGVYFYGAGAAWNTLHGNLIGTDVTGMLGLGNSAQGVFGASAPSNTVGGTLRGAGNVISANGLSGIRLRYPGTDAWVIQGNCIGTRADGTGDLGNYQHTIELFTGSGARWHVIGGSEPGAGNRIAYTRQAGFDGVRIRDGCTNNLVVGNAIWANGGSAAHGLGIDLGAIDGVNTNDVGDVDLGANQLQNFPVLTNAWASPTVTAICGMFSGMANKTYRLHFYANTIQEPSGYGEGQTYLGEASVSTPVSGVASFAVNLPVSVPANSSITATATDAANNTSEFSQALTALPQPDLAYVTDRDAALMTLQWTNTATGFALEQTTNLEPDTVWSPVTNIPVLLGGQYAVSLTTTNENRFFRLRLP